MVDLTAIILTKNENLNIESCIKSIKHFAKRIVVVDSFSDDNTVDVAKSLGADVYKNEFIDYSTQFNWALDNSKITTEWCLRLDADERFTDELKQEVTKIIKNNKNTNINGIVLEASLYFLNKKLRFGASRKRKLMIFRYGQGRIENRKMDEHTILSSGTSITAKNRYLHYDYKNIDIFVKKLNWYATRELYDYLEYRNNSAIASLNDERIKKTRKLKFGLYYKLPLFFRSFILFNYFHFFKLGFLDGREGYIYNYLYTRYYRLLVDIKIYEYSRFKNDLLPTKDLK